MRLIDVDAIEYPEYFNSEEAHPDPFIEGFRQGKIDAVCEVRALTPTIDAVPVVRCKDCKHYHADTLSCDFTPHAKYYERPNWYEDDFCSYGERKDGGGNGQ